MSIDQKNLPAAIEAILFIHGETLRVAEIARITGSNTEEVGDALTVLQARYGGESSGLAIIRNGDDVGLVTKPHFANILNEFIKDEFEENLSPASLEALALIAYLGPVSRSSIDYYRGVNSSFILRSLLLRGLVLRLPDPKRGNSFLYRASAELIRYLGIGEVQKLPDYIAFKEELHKLEGSESRGQPGLNERQ
ncbi:SMC-Scp complex subunit ScpB [Candidatus Wolfebacteria bacterium]|nr:SMC-Scp complex subunit ScpB [Candidatus Wolfebacteria bacterium]